MCWFCFCGLLLVGFVFVVVGFIWLVGLQVDYFYCCWVWFLFEWFVGGGLCFLLVCLFGSLGLWLVPLGALRDYVALRFNSVDGFV